MICPLCRYDYNDTKDIFIDGMIVSVASCEGYVTYELFLKKSNEYKRYLSMYPDPFMRAFFYSKMFNLVIKGYLLCIGNGVYKYQH